MYKKIMVPVDLNHLDQLEKSLTIAADLALHFKCGLCYVGVTIDQPSEVAKNPEEFERKLGAFADKQATIHGISASSHSFIAHDIVLDIDDVLIRAIEETGVDLVVMASHEPRFSDHFWPSNSSKIATHSKVSLFIVR
ncbi:MAG: universal stress protein [Pseudomonadota bacterium]